MPAWGRMLLLTIACGAILVACGGDGGEPIPAEDAQILLERLTEVERGLAEGNCDGEESAPSSARLFQAQLSDGELGRVPPDLDDEERELLDAGATQLVELVEEECRRIEQEEADEAEDVEPEVPDEPVEPPAPPEPPEDEAEPEERPDDDDDRGRGNQGRGGGNQGGGNQGGGGSGGGPGQDGSGGAEQGGSTDDGPPSGGIGG